MYNKRKRMEQLRTIPKNQVVMAFVATSIETTARFLGVSYSEIYQRMNRVGMIDNYILPNYDYMYKNYYSKLGE